MTTRRQGFIVVVAALMALYASAALAAQDKKCKKGDFPATGQTTPYMSDKNDGIVGPVAVPDDGTVQAGATLSYTDNGDGTITDNNTCLMWEKKSFDGGLHDANNAYRWSGGEDVETIWDWLDEVNGEGGTGFAGYSDWRVPNVKELQSIVNYENFVPAVSSPAFNDDCTATSTCTVLTCSCTAAAGYWSSSTPAGGSDFAWVVSFGGGSVFGSFKNNGFPVRAVRGGSNLGSSQ
jgi:hypothetical protein